MESECLEYDVVIVGAGPAGLAAAIRLKQLEQQQNINLAVCIIEKGAEIGSHILSGAVFEPTALNELLPDWASLNAPLKTKVSSDAFFALTANYALRLPTPAELNNHGNYIISLGLLCRWLGEQAEALGVEIYTGFAAVDCLYDDHDQVIGIQTGDMGRNKSGEPGNQFQAGIQIKAKQTLLTEGCRGSLSQQVIKKYQLAKDADPQTYGIGFKEIWRVDNALHQPGKVTHTIGWPLDNRTYGGSFLYHTEENQLNVGFVLGLDYQNPYLNPYEEFQRFKTHPAIRGYFENGERLSYGARALNEGGYQSIPNCHFPGGALAGCSAGFMNVGKIKGSHTAMKTGMMAAEAIFEYLANQDIKGLSNLTQAIKQSWVGQELYRVRNLRPGFQKGLFKGLMNAAIDSFIFRGRAPWTRHHHADHSQIKPAADYTKIDYPKPDDKLTFDKLTSLQLSHVYHEENQPCHLLLSQPSFAIEHNLKKYDSPETRYCPAGVYEIVQDAQQQAALQINAQNCIHCKTCDIKDPKQNITWTPPEGGGGPNYSCM